MECINKIVLQGVVGTIRIANVADTQVARIALATNFAYVAKDGCPVIETTWHNIIAWKKEGIDFDSLQRGDKVYLEGRLRTTKFTDLDGIERTSVEVLVNTLKKVEESLA